VLSGTAYYHFYYPAFLLLALLAGTVLVASEGQRVGFRMARLMMAQVALGSLAFAGARLFSILTDNRGGIGSESVLAWGAGARAPGGELALVVAVPAAAWLAGLPVRGYADVMAPSAALALAVGRLGCLAQGCCFGTPSELPWAIRFPRGAPAYVSHLAEGLVPASNQDSLPVHPLQLYFATSGVAITAILLWRARRKRFDGEIFLWLLLLRPASKYALEFFRGHGTHVPEPDLQSIPLAMALVVSIALTGIYASFGSRPAKKAGHA
jgi:phosphatidylglycerol:prolipoprotein diacylglycerol transferase